MSIFSELEYGEPIEITELHKEFSKDPFEKKVYLGSVTYRTEEGKFWNLPVVRALEKSLSYDNSLNKEYLPPLGIDAFSMSATRMLLGLDSRAVIQNKYFGIQCFSGSGALRIGAEFLARVIGKRVFYVSTPTWENHKRIFLHAGFDDAREYRYWNNATRRLDFDGLTEDLKNALPDSVIILQVCGHNPTGTDPNQEQWDTIANIFKERKLFPFFDSAYQGFVSGNLSKDAYSVRKFASLGIELFCAQSFSKMFCLASERVGNLTVVVENLDLIPAIKSQMSRLVQGMYWNPANKYARIVTTILTNAHLFNQLQDNINNMRSRVKRMAVQLRQAIEHLDTPGNWCHITQHDGIFILSGLTELQAENMRKKHHIYLLKCGRMGLSGLNTSNIYYVAEAIYDSVTLFPTHD